MTIKQSIAKEGQLSISSLALFQGCQKRYWHYKVNKTPLDPDAIDDSEALNVGKAFHEILDLNKHLYSVSNIKEVCEKFKVQHHESLIHAMVFAYCKRSKALNRELIATELKIETEYFLGFIDLLFKDNKGWYIGDLKTTANLTDTTIARLSLDTQLNMYATFVPEIANMYGLNPEEFRGCFYIAVSKPKLKQKANETDKEYTLRIASSVDVTNVFIAKEKLKPKMVIERHQRVLQEIKNLSNPLQNFSYCDSYFRPCPYWSQCFGKTYHECIQDAEKI